MVQPRGQENSSQPLPILILHIFSTPVSLSYSLYNTLVSLKEKKCFAHFCQSSRQVIKPDKGWEEPYSYNQQSQILEAPTWHSKGKAKQVCHTEPFTCGIRCQCQAEGITLTGIWRGGDLAHLVPEALRRCTETNVLTQQGCWQTHTPRDTYLNYNGLPAWKTWWYD